MTVKRVCLILSILLSVVGSAAAESGTTLWNAAIRSFRENVAWQPGLIRVSFSQYNRREEQISSARSVLRVSVGTDGELETTVLESYEDGESLDDGDSSGGPPFESDDNPFAILQESPFDPAMQDRVRYEPTGAVRTIQGLRSVGFGYTVAGEGRRRAVGTAWLAEESGVPVLLEATIDPLPVYLETFTASQLYSGDALRWTVVSVGFEADVRFLLIRRRIESELEFSDYFLYEG